jgi:hypothetical protein
MIFSNLLHALSSLSLWFAAAQVIVALAIVTAVLFSKCFRSPVARLKAVAAAVIVLAMIITLLTGDAVTAIVFVSICAIGFAPSMHSYALGIVVQGREIKPTISIPANAEFDPSSFADMVNQLRDQVNAMLAGLPPLEQFDASQELAYAFRCLTQSAANFLEVSEAIKSSASRLAKSVQAKAEQEAEAKLLQAGEFVKKVDADAAATAAADKREQDVKGKLEAAATAKREGDARRQKLIDDKVLSANVTAALPEEFFAADGYDARVAKLTARVKTLTEKTLNAEEFMADVLALPTDENGDKTFEARVKSVESLGLKASRPAGGGGGGRPPLAIPTGSHADAEELCAI